MKNLALLLSVLLLLSACNGGTSSPDSDLALQDPPGSTGQGTGGSGGGIGGSGVTTVAASGITQGPISSFGSVIVNGQRFDTDNTTITTNGETASIDDLRVGMHIWADVDFDSSVAVSIDYQSTLIGPIESVSTATGEITVLKQTVNYGLGGALLDMRPIDLTAGKVVEISGLINADKVIIATMIRQVSDDTPYMILGHIDRIDEQQHLVVNGLQIDTDSADLTSFGNQQPSVDQQIVAVGSELSVDHSILVAQRVYPREIRIAASGVPIEIEGFVDMSFLDSLLVSGLSFVIDEDTEFKYPDGSVVSAALLKLNLRVEISGITGADGIITVQEIIIVPAEDSIVRGPVETLDSETRTLTIGGIDVRLTQDTQFNSRSSRKIRSFGDLHVGDFLSIEGAWLNTRLLAQHVTLINNSRPLLTGRVTDVDATRQQLQVIGKNIPMDNQTVFRDEKNHKVDLVTFLESIQPGDTISVEWKNKQSMDEPAREISID